MQPALKIELTPDAAQWVEAAIASGRFVTAEDAVRYAIDRAKRADLREMLDATEAEGGSSSTEEARRHVRDHLDRLNQTPKAPLSAASTSSGRAAAAPSPMRS